MAPGTILHKRISLSSFLLSPLWVVLALLLGCVISLGIAWSTMNRAGPPLARTYAVNVPMENGTPRTVMFSGWRDVLGPDRFMLLASPPGEVRVADVNRALHQSDVRGPGAAVPGWAPGTLRVDGPVWYTGQGFPMRCVHAWLDDNGVVHGGIDLTRRGVFGGLVGGPVGGKRVMACTPSWLGLAVNSAVYALPVMGLMLGVRGLWRRVRGVAPGCCTGCGYDLAGLGSDGGSSADRTCPECGRVVRSNGSDG